MKRVGGHSTSQSREVIDALAGGLFAEPVRRTDLRVAAGASIIVPHGIGHRPRGWVILRKSAAGDLYEDYSHPQQEHSLKLVNPGAGEVIFDLAVLR